MPKLTKKELQDREFLVWFYKWEFLRRNEEFLIDFKPIQNYILNIKPPKGFNIEIARQLPPDKIAELINSTPDDIKKWENTAHLYLQLCKKWEMPGFINTSTTLKDFIKFEDVSFHNVFGYFSLLLLSMIRGAQETCLGIRPVFPAFFNIPSLQKHKIKNPDILDISINLNFPKPIILAMVELFIDAGKMSHAESNKKQKRARLEEYEKYLEIYDLRKSGLDFFDIAEKVYPESIKKRDGVIVEENTRRNFRKCTRLIQEGYKHIK